MASDLMNSALEQLDQAVQSVKVAAEQAPDAVAMAAHGVSGGAIDPSSSGWRSSCCRSSSAITSSGR